MNLTIETILKWLFYSYLSSGSPKIPKLWISQFCGFTIFSSKLQLRSFQLQGCNIQWNLFDLIFHGTIERHLTLVFLGFSGWESNCLFDFCQFDSQPFFWPYFLPCSSKWKMQTHFWYVSFESFQIILKNSIWTKFTPFALLFQIFRTLWDFNSHFETPNCVSFSLSLCV